MQDQQLLFPRLSSRGPIEVMRAAAIGCGHVMPFPRLSSRGPIEVTLRRNVCANLASGFRDYQVAAPLKWPPNEDPQEVLAKFPRLSSRGPIEASPA